MSELITYWPKVYRKIETPRPILGLMLLCDKCKVNLKATLEDYYFIIISLDILKGHVKNDVLL